jgi:hypothetical protein
LAWLKAQRTETEEFTAVPFGRRQASDFMAGGQIGALF